MRAPTTSTRTHAIHTSVTSLDAAADGAVRATVRIYADDLGTAVTRHSGVPSAVLDQASNNRVVAYVASAFSISDVRGGRLSLASCGVQHLGDAVLVCLETRTPVGLRGARLTNRILFEVHDDQVNIVRATLAGQRQSLLFTRAEPIKPLR